MNIHKLSQFLRRTIAALLLVVLISGPVLCQQQTKPELNNWDNVSQALNNAEVLILTNDGKRMRGKAVYVSDISISVLNKRNYILFEKDVITQVARADVKEVRVKKLHPAVKVTIGFAAGMAAGGGIGYAAGENEESSDYLAAIGLLAGMGIGAATASIIDAAQKGRLIYQAP